jgi:Na+-translocating ferredoxin:NAD+ oxidoreductase subunit B
MSATAPIPATELALDPLALRLNALLPQTQCMRCGFQGCAPYAQAIAAGDAPINQCPPGGARVIEEIAAVLQHLPLPLDPARGCEAPLQAARIVEADCIGCTKCIQVCPVDAIVGASKRMHSVITTECTGCELCIPACPVDCIQLEPHPAGQMTPVTAAIAKRRFEYRSAREAARKAAKALAIERQRNALRGEHR